MAYLELGLRKLGSRELRVLYVLHVPNMYVLTQDGDPATCHHPFPEALQPARPLSERD